MTMISPLRGPITEACAVCHAKPGEPCRNTIDVGEPLPGREWHRGHSETSVYCVRCGNVHESGKCGR